MDAIIAYLTQKLKNTFYSHPPSSALILWWPTSSLDQQGTFISRKMDAPPHPLEDCLRETLRASLVLYSYDSEKDLLRFDIEGKMLEGRWDDPFLEKEVAAELGIPYHPGGTGKPPNDLQQVRDLFHVWSRKAFAGIKKTDVDLVLLSDKNDARVLVEVKRSAKKKVGEWIPYPIDPYDGLAYFARTWGAKLVTVHHEIIGGGHAEKPSPENILVDVFAYDPRSPFDFASFACENNRRVTTLDELVVELKSLLEQ